MRQSTTITRTVLVSASIMVLSTVFSTAALGCQDKGPDSPRIIRGGGSSAGQNPSASAAGGGTADPEGNGGGRWGSGRGALRSRIVQRMKQGAGRGESAGGVWTREFDEPAPWPVSVDVNHAQYSVSAQGLGVLHAPDCQPMYYGSGCDVTWTIAPVTDGYDIVYSVTNTNQTDEPLPTLQIGGNTMGSQVDFLDEQVACNWMHLDGSSGRAWSPTSLYPQVLYAPVVIVKNSQYAIGFSLQYPMLAYKHQIKTYFGLAPGQYGNMWNCKFFLDGTLPAGESRQYTVNVRYAQPENWIYTIKPYKEFFHEKYGDVRYVQNLQPVWGLIIGDSQLLSQDNPRGFRPTRADRNGWQADVDYTMDWVVPSGFKRVMIWSAAGVYNQNRQNNYPPQFMADWTAPMLTTESQWRRVPAAGIDLLFWWGRSGQYASSWDAPELVQFDPVTASDATRMMLGQWQTALSRGASGVGLDAFTQMDGWKTIPWIAALRELKPDGTIVAEPCGFDLLNLHVPTFMYSTDLAQGPQLLADYLVPGREIWVLLMGSDSTVERAEYFIRNGYTVVCRDHVITSNELQDAVAEAQAEGGTGAN